jgi:hypothetical protein
MSLLDRRARPTPEIAQGLAALGWQLECLEEEVVSWLAKAGNRSWSAIFANLFLHHFEDSVIARMLEQISERTPVLSRSSQEDQRLRCVSASWCG